MRWWFRATVTVAGVILVAVAVGLILFSADLRVPYPTLSGALLVSTSAAAFAAIIPPIVWSAMTRRAEREHRLGPVRTRVPILDALTVLAFPVALSVLAVVGITGASIALVPAFTYTSLALITAIPRMPRESRVLPAAALVVATLLGNSSEGPQAWALPLAEDPTPLRLLVAVGACAIAAFAFSVASITRRR